MARLIILPLPMLSGTKRPSFMDMTIPPIHATRGCKIATSNRVLHKLDSCSRRIYEATEVMMQRPYSIWNRLKVVDGVPKFFRHQFGLNLQWPRHPRSHESSAEEPHTVSREPFYGLWKYHWHCLAFSCNPHPATVNFATFGGMLIVAYGQKLFFRSTLFTIAHRRDGFRFVGSRRKISRNRCARRLTDSAGGAGCNFRFRQFQTRLVQEAQSLSRSLVSVSFDCVSLAIDQRRVKSSGCKILAFNELSQESLTPLASVNDHIDLLLPML